MERTKGFVHEGAQLILQSKIQKPRRSPFTVERSRLISLLNPAPQRKLTLLSAAAGYGKTTLLRNWASCQQQALAWLTLDPEDNHTARFARYLRAAWQEREGATPAERPSFTTPQLDTPLDQLLPALVNQLQQTNEAVSFIFDDAHHLQSSAVLGALSFLIDNLPPQAQVIVASRTDPELGLGRLRAHGFLEELRSPQLRFTLEELAQFIEGQLGVELSKSQLNELMKKTEGWPAGLQLVAHLLKGRHQLPQIIEGFHGDHPYVVDYLAGEVLEGLNPALRTFLIRSSVLPSMDAALCDELLERDDSQELLAQVQSENLFLEPINPLQERYRYHPLFHDYLRKRFRESLNQDEQRHLHGRASRALQSRGLHQLAIPHAIQADNLEEAVTIIGSQAQHAMNVGDAASVQRWLAWLPQAIVENDYQLATWYSWSRAVSGKLQDIDHWLGIIDPLDANGLEADPANLEYHYHAVTIRATVSRFRGNTEQAIQHANRALEILPPDRPILKAIALLNKGHALLLSGRVEAAIPLLEQAGQLAQSVGHRYVALSAQFHLGKCHLARGAFEQAELTFAEADRPIDDDSNHGLRCVYHLGMGLLQMERGKLDQAQENIEISIRLSQIIRDFIFMREALEAHLRLNLLKGEPVAAENSLQRLEAVRQPMGPADPSISTQGLSALVDQIHGYQEPSYKWAQQLLAQHFAEPDQSQRSLILDALSIYFSVGPRDPASAFHNQLIQLLERLRQQALADRRQLDWVRFSLNKALAHHHRSEQALARQLLLQAIQGAPVGAQQALMTGAPNLWPLWRWAGRQLKPADGQEAGEVSRVEALLAEYQQRYPQQTAQLPPQKAGEEPLPEDLSEREAQVLRLLAQGKTSRQVAEALVITYNTARTHIRNIYRKLDVHSRLEAVQRAQELQVV